MEYFNKRQIIDRLASRLEQKGINAKAFYSVLQVLQAYVSGSFLLAAIIDAEWGSKDLDIFISGEVTNESISKAFADQGLELREMKRCTILYYTGLSEVWAAQLGDMKVDICRSRTRVIDCCRECFDIDVCANLCDGNDLFIMHPEGVFKREARYSNTMGCGALMVTRATERIKKYTERGFNFVSVSLT